MSTEVESYLKTNDGFTRINDYDGAIADTDYIEECYRVPNRRARPVDNATLGLG